MIFCKEIVIEKCWGHVDLYIARPHGQCDKWTPKADDRNGTPTDSYPSPTRPRAALAFCANDSTSVETKNTEKPSLLPHFAPIFVRLGVIFAKLITVR